MESPVRTGSQLENMAHTPLQTISEANPEFEPADGYPLSSSLSPTGLDCCSSCSSIPSTSDVLPENENPGLSPDLDLNHPKAEEEDPIPDEHRKEGIAQPAQLRKLWIPNRPATVGAVEKAHLVGLRTEIQDHC